MNDNEYLVTDEVAKLLRISCAKVKKMRRLGDGPVPIKVGSRVIYPRAEVDRWVNGHYSRPPAAASAPNSPMPSRMGAT